MRKFFPAIVLAGLFLCAGPLRAQQVCPGFSIVINTPEDALMLAVNGADTPEEQIAALDKYSQENPDSKFMPCVDEYYTLAYLKLNQFDKVIEYGEKGLSGDYQDLMLMLNTVKGYVSAGKVSDSAFEIIMKAPAEIKKESTVGKSTTMTEEEWKKAQEDATAQAKDQQAYMEYAFFQLLQRETDGNKAVAWLDRFVQAYPETPNTAQVNFNYFLAYKMANNPAKTDEYGEKAVASDPDNVVYLNLVADDYATRQTNLDKAAEYAQKALALVPGIKKPENMNDEQFKANQDNQLGLAHLTLGYIEFQREGERRRVAPAIKEFQTAIDLLGSNPALQARALYYLGYASEVISPPNHRQAAEALERAAAITSPWQSASQELLAKVKKAMGH
jgi:tetratricopeptide (TPR) repeat protein